MFHSRTRRDRSRWYDNYISVFDRVNETEIRVSLDWLNEEYYGFELEYTLRGVVKESLLPVYFSVKHTLNLQTPYIIEFDTVTVRVWTDLHHRIKVISSNIHQGTHVMGLFPARYIDKYLYQIFHDIPHGSMNLSIEWRHLNPIEIYLHGLRNTVILFPIYFSLSALVFLLLRVLNPPLAMRGWQGLFCTFLAYLLIIPLVYWIPLIHIQIGQFFTAPLAFIFAKSFLIKQEAVVLAFYSSLSPALIFISFILSFYKGLFPPD